MSAKQNAEAHPWARTMGNFLSERIKFNRFDLILRCFRIFCANGGPKVFSDVVRRAKGGKLAGKAARVLTTIAYTLDDSRKF